MSTLGGMGEKTIPVLPCPSIPDVVGLYQALGFEVTHLQTRPNPYASLRYGDIDLPSPGYGVQTGALVLAFTLPIVLPTLVAAARVLMGAGIRFFDNLTTAPIELEGPRVVEGTGVTYLPYRVRTSS